MAASCGRRLMCYQVGGVVQHRLSATGHTVVATVLITLVDQRLQLPNGVAFAVASACP